MVTSRRGSVGLVAHTPLDKFVDNAAGRYDAILGQEVESLNGDTFRFVELNKTGGFLAANKQFFYTSAAAFTVQPVAAATDRVCGVGNPALGALTTLTDKAGFWVQVDGRTQLQRGDDATAIVAGDQIGPDDDADLGKSKKNATYAEGVTEFVALTAAASADDLFDAQIKTRLVG